MSSLDRSMPLITVAIATFNRAETLRRALTSIAQLKSDGFRLEAVVVDNGSTDHTKEIIQAVAQRCSFPIRYAYESQPGLPFARNRALTESQGDWIAFFDDDQLTEPNWLATLYRTAQRQQVKCVGGARSLLIESDVSSEMAAYCRSLLGEIAHAEASDYHFRDLPCTGNVLVHRSLFDQLGRFNEAVIDGGEDSDFFYRVIALGIRCVYDPYATVQHIIPQQRLERNYLELIAFRHGRHVCRRDFQYRGRLLTYISAMARILLVGFSSRIRMAWAFLLGRHDEVVGQSCKWHRARGYLSFALRNSADTTELSNRTMHRGR